MLYLIESYLNSDALEALQQQLQTDDDVVCLSDGVYCLAALNANAHNIHALTAHAQLRGVVVAEEVNTIDMMDLVALSVKHPTSVTR
jgi:sulfur relay protein TusB/DsrH